MGIIKSFSQAPAFKREIESLNGKKRRTYDIFKKSNAQWDVFYYDLKIAKSDTFAGAVKDIAKHAKENGNFYEAIIPEHYYQRTGDFWFCYCQGNFVMKSKSRKEIELFMPDYAWFLDFGSKVSN